MFLASFSTVRRIFKKFLKSRVLLGRESKAPLEVLQKKRFKGTTVTKNVLLLASSLIRGEFFVKESTYKSLWEGYQFDKILKERILLFWLGIVVHTCNFRTWEAEAGRSPSPYIQNYPKHRVRFCLKNPRQQKGISLLLMFKFINQSISHYFSYCKEYV